MTPAMFAHFVNLLRPLASGKLCVIQEVSSEYFSNALRRNKANHWAKYSLPTTFEVKNMYYDNVIRP